MLFKALQCYGRCQMWSSQLLQSPTGLPMEFSRGKKKTKKKTRTRDLIRRVDVQHYAGCVTSISARQLGYSTASFQYSQEPLDSVPPLLLYLSIQSQLAQLNLHSHTHTHSRVWFPQRANAIMKITSQQSSIKLTASPFPFSPPSRQETIKARHIAASSGFLSLQQNYSPRLWSHCWRLT